MRLAAALAVVALAVMPAPVLASERTRSASPIDRYTLFAAPTVLLRNAQLFDGNGNPPRTGVSLLIQDGRIAKVGTEAEVDAPPNALVRDLDGAAVMPGFVLLHEHLFYPIETASYGSMFRSFPLLYLAGGVTTMRTTGSIAPYADLNLWRDIQAQVIAGPDIDVTAPFINGATAFFAQLQRLQTPADAERMVQYWADEGATSFKGYMHLSRAQLSAAIQAAHARKLKVTAHLCSITYREAADLGVDNLEHGFLAASDFVADKTPDACPPGDAVPQSLDALAADDPAMRRLQSHLIDRGVAITSTLTVFETFAHGRPPTPAAALDLLIAPLREQYETGHAAIQARGPNSWSRLLPKAMAWEKQFSDAGGLLVAGTDPSGYGGVLPGFAAMRQLELLIEAGFEVPMAIRVMTANGARYLGRDHDVGRIEPGKRADLVVLAGPITPGAALPEIAWTMKAGRAFNRARILATWKGRVGLQ